MNKLIKSTATLVLCSLLYQIAFTQPYDPEKCFLFNDHPTLERFGYDNFHVDYALEISWTVEPYHSADISMLKAIVNKTTKTIKPVWDNGYGWPEIYIRVDRIKIARFIVDKDNTIQIRSEKSGKEYPFKTIFEKSLEELNITKQYLEDIYPDKIPIKKNYRKRNKLIAQNLANAILKPTTKYKKALLFNLAAPLIAKAEELELSDLLNINPNYNYEIRCQNGPGEGSLIILYGVVKTIQNQNELKADIQMFGHPGLFRAIAQQLKILDSNHN